MKRLVLLTTVAAFTLTSGIAGAATLTNLDKADTSVEVHVKGSAKTTITLKQNAVYDSKGVVAYFILGKQKPAMGLKGDEHFVIKNGKIVPAHDGQTVAKTPSTSISR